MKAATVTIQYIQDIQQGNIRALSRAISFIENEAPGYESLLSALPQNNSTRIIGITGPPGAGKSTLTDALTESLLKLDKKIAILCIDPSSPFSKGAVLGDRIRMGRWYDEPKVYIRSLATRGWLGGLHPKVLEITELLKFAAYDYILVETVGVGQSEVEIAGLADLTLVVLVPEAGDDIQTMKAGLMEIADIFVVNKADRPEANRFVKNLQQHLYPSLKHTAEHKPIFKTVASTQEGIAELSTAIQAYFAQSFSLEDRAGLLTEKAWQLIQQKRMKNMSRSVLREEITQLLEKGTFNLYKLVEEKV
ncbi:methylmalonyl Co-A mutase-associated GTPase MeaB [Parasegetibacter sp. NRK P23]|uniref:methylmalonyl Co-A mutase-associated GTPase MeaB n=1 Tax=Parasegetibacter sp. NRK P23 TaxID=2942999 RepID=UPI00204392A0|nr:methylmalonyl Co-A mutase-associated GTPase MeaB [Parasegetibacter sp. NRK P23]MCM5530032.1 methylmalonyl Co-A mutase-associated GTPase MeaB [Parasegetibacter sp. NRK P23]